MTSYYSSNVSSADAKLIDQFCQDNKISPLNTRLLKSADGKEFELRICSSMHSTEQTPYLKTYELEGDIKVHVTAADFQEFMQKVVIHLEHAKENAADQNQEQMIENYITHFKFGE